jgi:predicted secreted protein
MENQVEKKTNGFAIAGLVCALLVGPILGLIFSIIGLVKSKTTNTGKGLSIAGIIVSIIRALFLVLIIFLFAAVMKTDDFKTQFCDELAKGNQYEQACSKNEDGTYNCIFATCNFADKTETDELRIQFNDNASTGYYWKYDVSNKGIVDINSKTDYSGCEDKDGCGGKIIYTLTSLKAGKTTITFKYLSPSDEVDRTVEYEIEVTKDLKIKETHKEK